MQGGECDFNQGGRGQKPKSLWELGKLWNNPVAASEAVDSGGDCGTGPATAYHVESV